MSRNIDSDKWYKEAEKMTFLSLPDFIKKVRYEFPIDQSNEGYQNSMIVGVLTTYATFHAASNTYGFSCNQAGVVRNVLYKAIFDENIPLDRL